MTEIEKKALALVNEVRAELGWNPDLHLSRKTSSREEALCRAIEQHEAFRQEVSEFALGVKGYMASVKALAWQDDCDCFIIPKPDPLVEALDDLKDRRAGQTTESYAACLRAALAKRGLEIKEVDHD